MPARTRKRKSDAVTVLAPVKERLTRERVVDAALRIMDDEGLDAVTMRRVVGSRRDRIMGMRRNERSARNQS